MAAIQSLQAARGDLAQHLSHSNPLQYEVAMAVESSRRCGLLALGNVSPQYNFRRISLALKIVLRAVKMIGRE